LPEKHFLGTNLHYAKHWKIINTVPEALEGAAREKNRKERFKRYLIFAEGLA
jgi:hypothetical protein